MVCMGSGNYKCESISIAITCATVLLRVPLDDIGGWPANQRFCQCAMQCAMASHALGTTTSESEINWATELALIPGIENAWWHAATEDLAEGTTRIRGGCRSPTEQQVGPPPPFKGSPIEYLRFPRRR